MARLRAAERIRAHILDERAQPDVDAARADFAAAAAAAAAAAIDGRRDRRMLELRAPVGQAGRMVGQIAVSRLPQSTPSGDHRRRGHHVLEMRRKVAAEGRPAAPVWTSALPGDGAPPSDGSVLPSLSASVGGEEVPRRSAATLPTLPAAGGDRPRCQRRRDRLRSRGYLSLGTRRKPAGENQMALIWLPNRRKRRFAVRSQPRRGAEMGSKVSQGLLGRKPRGRASGRAAWGIRRVGAAQDLLASWWLLLSIAAGAALSAGGS